MCMMYLHRLLSYFRGWSVHLVIWSSSTKLSCWYPFSAWNTPQTLPTPTYSARGSSPSPGGFSDFPQGAVITSSLETLHLLPFTVSATTDHRSVSSLTCRKLFSTRPSWVVENFKDEMFDKQYVSKENYLTMTDANRQQEDPAKLYWGSCEWSQRTCFAVSSVGNQDRVSGEKVADRSNLSWWSLTDSHWWMTWGERKYLANTALDSVGQIGSLGGSHLYRP